VVRFTSVPRSRDSVASVTARGVFWAACLGVSIGSGGAAIAAGGGQPAGSGVIPFDIPSQPLSSAIEAYARGSGREVLYNGALAAGRRSGAVEGVYTPAAALRTLLDGTGLSAEFEDADFFVLVPTPPAELSASGTDAVQSTFLLRYYGRLQARLKSAFCDKSEVLPGRYRVAARLWIGPSGGVLQEKRLASTGNIGLDRRIDDTLRGLRLDNPPPAGLAQPITIVIMPNAPDVRRDCDGAGLRERAVKAGP